MAAVTRIVATKSAFNAANSVASFSQSAMASFNAVFASLRSVCACLSYFSSCAFYSSEASMLAILPWNYSRHVIQHLTFWLGNVVSRNSGAFLQEFSENCSTIVAFFGSLRTTYLTSQLQESVAVGRHLDGSWPEGADFT